MIKDFIIGKRYHLNIKDVQGTFPGVVSGEDNSIIFGGISGKPLRFRYKQLGQTATAWIQIAYNNPTYNQIAIVFEDTGIPVVHAVQYYLNDQWVSNIIDIQDLEWIEIVGYFVSGSFDTSAIKNWFLKYSTDASVQIELYVNVDEVNVLEKSPTFVDTLWGTFKQEVDVINPSIIVECSSLPNFNYINIVELQRYYFVRNITILRDGIYRIDCHVDVLYSYYQDIEDQEDVFILRNETASDSSLVDNRKPLSSIPTITYSDVSGGTKANVTFNDNYAQSGNEHRFYVLALRDLTQQKNNLNPPSGTNLPVISDKTGEHECRYILTYNQFSAFLKALYNNSALSSYVENIIYIPFDFDDLTATYITEKLMVNDSYLKTDGTWTTNGSDVLIRQVNGWGYSIPYLIVADFAIAQDYSNEESFLNIEPYTRYDIYLPFIGWVNLPSIDVVGKNILVYYAMNEEDGTGTCYVKNTTDDKIVYSGTCQIGVRIGVDYTNALELSTQKNANVMNTALGALSGVLSLGVGVFTGKPLAGVAGIMGTAKALESGINRDAMMFEKAQSSVNGSSNAMYGDITHVYLKKQQLSKITIDEDVYGHMNGYPINSYGGLSSFSGYTECVIHWSSSNTQIVQAEIDEIESLAKGGIII